MSDQYEPTETATSDQRADEAQAVRGPTVVEQPDVADAANLPNPGGDAELTALRHQIHALMEENARLREALGKVPPQ